MVWAVSVIPFEKLKEISYTEKEKATSPNFMGNLKLLSIYLLCDLYYNCSITILIQI